MDGGVHKLSLPQYFQGLASGLMCITQGLIRIRIRIPIRIRTRMKSAATAEILRVSATLQIIIYIYIYTMFIINIFNYSWWAQIQCACSY